MAWFYRDWTALKQLYHGVLLVLYLVLWHRAESLDLCWRRQLKRGQCSGFLRVPF